MRKESDLIGSGGCDDLSAGHVALYHELSHYAGSLAPCSSFSTLGQNFDKAVDLSSVIVRVRSSSNKALSPRSYSRIITDCLNTL